MEVIPQSHMMSWTGSPSYCLMDLNIVAFLKVHCLQGLMFALWRQNHHVQKDYTLSLFQAFLGRTQSLCNNISLGFLQFKDLSYTCYMVTNFDQIIITKH